MLAGLDKVSSWICRDEMAGIEQSVLAMRTTQPMAVCLIVERLYAVAYRAQNDIDLMTVEMRALKRQLAALQRQAPAEVL